MNGLILIVVACLFGAREALAQGRSFPEAAQVDAKDAFRDISPFIEFDESFQLVNLAGSFASCPNIDKEGFTTLTDRTPEGYMIEVLSGSTYGEEGHVNAVAGYIRTVLEEWSSNAAYTSRIVSAARFGCAVAPFCSRRVSVACAFATPPPSSDLGSGDEVVFLN